MAAGNLFSLVFGRNLDAHEASPSLFSETFLPKVSAEPRCGQGLECYVATVYLTIGATSLSICLSPWAGWRDRRKIRGVVGQGALTFTNQTINIHRTRFEDSALA